jgi:hypothetical protein
LQAALLGAKVTDVDYLAFKIREKGDIQLTEDGKIKGIDETLAGLKTQYPQFFTAESKKKIEENKLPEGEPGGTMTKEQFSKLGYQDRNKLFRDDPETYKNMMKE